MMRAKVNLKNIIAYIVGNIRYRLYYSRYKLLIRKHVREQIDMRIKFMKKECYENGTCIICGCATTALQMANKACDDRCYPKMMSKQEWEKFYNKHESKYCYSTSGWWRYYKTNNPYFNFQEHLTFDTVYGTTKTLYPNNNIKSA